MTITVLDANDNTPTFDNVSYNVDLFTDVTPGETVIQVHAHSHAVKNSTDFKYLLVAAAFLNSCVLQSMYVTEPHLKPDFL